MRPVWEVGGIFGVAFGEKYSIGSRVWLFRQYISAGGLRALF